MCSVVSMVLVTTDEPPDVNSQTSGNTTCKRSIAVCVYFIYSYFRN